MNSDDDEESEEWFDAVEARTLGFATNPEALPRGENQVFPDEVLFRIFHSLSVEDRFAAAKSCRSWRRVVADVALWHQKEIIVIHPPNDPKAMFQRYFRFADSLTSVRIKFSKETPSEITPLATLSFHNIFYASCEVNLGSEIALIEAIGDKCPNLKVIKLQYMQFLDLMTLGYLWKFAGLSSVSIVDSFVEDSPQVMDTISSHCPGLRLLEVPFMTDSELLMLGRKVGSTLNALYFHAHRLEGTALDKKSDFAKNFGRLQALGISYLEYVGGLFQIRQLNSLVILKLVSFTNASVLSENLNETNFPHLIHLTVSSLHFNDNFGERLWLPNLRHLGLESENAGSQFSDAGVATISEKTQNLTSLRLEFFKNVTRETIEDIGRKRIFPKLQRLFVVSCVKIGTKAMEALVKSRAGLTVVNDTNYGKDVYQHPSRRNAPNLYSEMRRETYSNPSIFAVNLLNESKNNKIAAEINASSYNMRFFVKHYGVNARSSVKTLHMVAPLGLLKLRRSTVRRNCGDPTFETS
ncbi:unnamed protein product [Notodromas monacha]|uniref:F-box domain-containing protein n=1 Tax=Notodromas monacha TaxID=399045 RepID=A0A7R9BLG3_9CRUS|nr:unnamed protein product [Notodromas monacha]CAG0917665.1 unnamed protein product [Notodromas monacha]